MPQAAEGFWERAKGLPEAPFKAAKKTAADYPIFRKLSELAERLAELPGADIGLGGGPIVGFTKQDATRNIIRKLFPKQAIEQITQGDLMVNPSPTFGLRPEMRDLLRVIGKTPKKAIWHIKEFKLWPGKAVTGTYHPESLNIFPAEDIAESMAGAFSHEAGHGASLPMFGRMIRKKYGLTPGGWPDSQQGMLSYQSEQYKEPLEGVAEYLGNVIQKRAGLSAEPYFGYGTGQIETFNKLMSMPSKNPYMNVYRYLQNLLRGMEAK